MTQSVDSEDNNVQPMHSSSIHPPPAKKTPTSSSSSSSARNLTPLLNQNDHIVYCIDDDPENKVERKKVALLLNCGNLEPAPSLRISFSDDEDEDENEEDEGYRRRNTNHAVVDKGPKTYLPASLIQHAYQYDHDDLKCHDTAYLSNDQQLLDKHDGSSSAEGSPSSVRKNAHRHQQSILASKRSYQDAMQINERVLEKNTTNQDCEEEDEDDAYPLPPPPQRKQFRRAIILDDQDAEGEETAASPRDIEAYHVSNQDAHSYLEPDEDEYGHSYTHDDEYADNDPDGNFTSQHSTRRSSFDGKPRSNSGKRTSSSNWFSSILTNPEYASRRTRRQRQEHLASAAQIISSLGKRQASSSSSIVSAGRASRSSRRGIKLESPSLSESNYMSSSGTPSQQENDRDTRSSLTNDDQVSKSNGLRPALRHSLRVLRNNDAGNISLSKDDKPNEKSDAPNYFDVQILPTKTREKKAVDYRRQLYPPDTLAAGEKGANTMSNNYGNNLYSGPLKNRWMDVMRPQNRGSPQKLHDNENDEETDIPTSRLMFLFKKPKNMSIFPLNFEEILTSERKALTGTSLVATKNGILSSSFAINFSQIAGLDSYILKLKEMISIPLLYPEIFESFHLSAPRGVLFHGPPGTGKTMMARALASSISSQGRPVAFFLRKGSDLLSKWVGDSEKNIIKLFEMAKALQPSIIFFDEIDGIAPVRSGKQDQVHASVVSTLLAMMDGLESRGQVIVIGATNRIDSVDPALRRPGRFDREFYFPLPNKDARRQMLQLSTKNWRKPLSETLLDELSYLTAGYNGADMKFLCTEAALNAVHRVHPEIYEAEEKLQIDHSKLIVCRDDFLNSLKRIVPSNLRSGLKAGRHLHPFLSTMFEDTMDELLAFVNSLLRFGHERRLIHPRIILKGSPGCGQNQIGSSLLLSLHDSSYHLSNIDLESLRAVDNEQQHIVQVFTESSKHQKSVIYIPDIDSLVDSMNNAVLSTFKHMLKSTHSLVLLSCSHLDFELTQFFSEPYVSLPWQIVINLGTPTVNERHRFFKSFVGATFPEFRDSAINLKDSVSSEGTSSVNVVKIPLIQAQATLKPNLLDDNEKRQIYLQFEKHRLAIRQYFSIILDDLKKNFRIFIRAPDPSQFVGYQPDVVMDLATMEDRALDTYYTTTKAFMADIELIVQNTLDFNDPAFGWQKDNIIKAKKLKDAAQEHIDLLPSSFISDLDLFEASYSFIRGILVPDAQEETDAESSATGSTVRHIAPADMEDLNAESSDDEVPNNVVHNAEPDIINNHLVQEIFASDAASSEAHDGQNMATKDIVAPANNSIALMDVGEIDSVSVIGEPSLNSAKHTLKDWITLAAERTEGFNVEALLSFGVYVKSIVLLGKEKQSLSVQLENCLDLVDDFAKIGGEAV